MYLPVVIKPARMIAKFYDKMHTLTQGSQWDRKPFQLGVEPQEYSFF